MRLGLLFASPFKALLMEEVWVVSQCTFGWVAGGTYISHPALSPVISSLPFTQPFVARLTFARDCSEQRFVAFQVWIVLFVDRKCFTIRNFGCHPKSNPDLVAPAKTETVWHRIHEANRHLSHS